MAANPVIIILTSLYLVSLSADSGAEEETFRPLCSRMCSSSANSRENVLFSYNCSCSKSCIVYDDCCYDSPYKHRARPSDLRFGCMSVAGLGDFRAVISCPPNWSGNFCSEQLGDMPPVTSRVTNITYGNVFCAGCNEDGDNLITWNVQLRCPKNSDPEDMGLDFTQLKYRWGRFFGWSARKTHWRSCKFYAHYNDFGILKDLELRPCVDRRKVSTCSETWRDPSVEEKCRSYRDPVYVGYVPFRNAHCAECHRANSSEVDCVPAYVREMLDEGLVDEDYLRSCMAASDSVRRCAPLPISPRGKVYSISIMFQPECLPPAGRLCCRGERYDESTAMCRRIRSG